MPFGTQVYNPLEAVTGMLKNSADKYYQNSMNVMAAQRDAQDKQAVAEHVNSIADAFKQTAANRQKNPNPTIGDQNAEIQRENDQLNQSILGLTGIGSQRAMQVASQLHGFRRAPVKPDLNVSLEDMLSQGRFGDPQTPEAQAQYKKLKFADQKITPIHTTDTMVSPDDNKPHVYMSVLTDPNNPQSVKKVDLGIAPKTAENQVAGRETAMSRERLAQAKDEAYGRLQAKRGQYQFGQTLDLDKLVAGEKGAQTPLVFSPTYDPSTGQSRQIPAKDTGYTLKDGSFISMNDLTAKKLSKSDKQDFLAGASPSEEPIDQYTQRLQSGGFGKPDPEVLDWMEKTRALDEFDKRHGNTYTPAEQTAKANLAKRNQQPGAKTIKLSDYKNQYKDQITGGNYTDAELKDFLSKQGYQVQ